MTPIRLRVREWRAAKGLSQQQLAEAAGIRRATISRLENGHATAIDFEVLERLADALGIDAAVLIEHERRTSGKRGRRGGG